eukprot:2352887-Ditylum_brightwellii.AAC.1
MASVAVLAVLAVLALWVAVTMVSLALAKSLSVADADCCVCSKDGALLSSSPSTLLPFFSTALKWQYQR